MLVMRRDTSVHRGTPATIMSHMNAITNLHAQTHTWLRGHVWRHDCSFARVKDWDLDPESSTYSTDWMLMDLLIRREISRPRSDGPKATAYDILELMSRVHL